jgi:uncharacterized protein YndB with AHSA1/START domain
MMNKNLTISFNTDKSAEEVFKAINNVRGWWGAGVTGGTEKPGDEFVYKHVPYHYSKQRLTEVVPGKKVVWLVTEGELSFTDEKSEWVNTKIIFEIEKKGKQTTVTFTHEGLTPSCECFDDCSQGWNHYLQSLLQLIETGKGNPDPASKSKGSVESVK